MAQRYGVSDPLRGVASDGLIFYIHPQLKQCWDGNVNSPIIDLVDGQKCTPTDMATDTNGYFVFNGTSSMINTNRQYIDDGAYSLSSTTDDYTLEAWIYVETSQGTTTNADSIIGSQGSYGVGMQVGINGTVPRINHGARSTSNFYSSNLTYNSWYHIVWSHDTGVGSTVYHNGVSDTTSSGSSYQISSTSANWGNMTIGNSSNRVSGYYDGKMGPIRMYNRAITSEEVTRNFNASRAKFGV